VNPLDILSWSVEHQPDGSWAVLDNNGNVISTLIGPPSGTGHVVQQPDGSYAVAWSDTGQSTPLDPSVSQTGTPVPAAAGSSPSSGGGTPAFDVSALKWLGALVLLWLILTALTEYSSNTQIFGQALAGLVLLGALFYLGPDAIKNVQNIWSGTQPTTPTTGA
jgi:hypothetical protein